MVDTSGLFMSEVEIIIENDVIKVMSQRRDCIEDALSLPTPIFACELSNGITLIYPQNTDPIALAERLATTWENRGYKVKRLVVPLGSSTRREVQSFVLAY
jgi:hypothetical protein